MTEQKSGNSENQKLGKEIGRYTTRRSEQFEPQQFDFEQWQTQLNQNFNQLANQLEKMHAELAQSLEDNVAKLVTPISNDNSQD